MKSPNTKWLDKAKYLLCLTVLPIFLFFIFSSLINRDKLGSQDQLALISNDTLPKIKNNTVAQLLDELFVKKDDIIKREEKLEKKKIRKSMWNPFVINTKENDEISLFIFNEQDKIDSILTNRIKSEFLKKNYTVTDQIIYSDQITPLIASNLKASKLDFFRGNLYRLTDYICIGIVSYKYKRNYFRKDLFDCTMDIKYYIYSASTGVVMFSEKDKIISTGKSKTMARLTAIQNFIL